MVQLANSAGITNVAFLLQGKFKPKHDDDLTDRINYAYTPSLLFIFALLVAGKQYFGAALQCWIPKQYPGQWERYSEAYCFVENTYFVNFEEDPFPRSIEERESRELLYYQWVPIILCTQLILFLVPKAIWSSLNFRTGLTVHGIIESAKRVKKVPAKLGQNRITFKERTSDAEDFITSLIKFNKEKQSMRIKGLFGAIDGFWYHFRVPAFLKGTYITNLYMAFKFFNSLNVLLQIVWLNMFLGPEYTFWGFGILMDLVNGVEWKQSGHFPRVTYCDIQIRQIGANIHRNTFQCVLMINMFNEKIFIFVWFWLFFLLVLNAFNLMEWLVLCYSEDSIKKFIKKHLNYKSIEIDDIELEIFINKMIFKDIATLLRLIEYNCGDLSTSIIIANIYEKYLKDEDVVQNALEAFAAPVA